MKINFTFIFFLFLSFILFNSCKKEAYFPGQLSIRFSSATIAIDHVDSVKVVFTNPQYNLKTELTLSRQVDVFTTAIPKTVQNWQASITVYEKEKPDGSRWMFTLTPSWVNQNSGNSFEVEAPNGHLADRWNSWIVFITDQSRLMVPANPLDPLFEVAVQKTEWDYVYFDKVSYKEISGLTERVGSAKWECSYPDCFQDSSPVYNGTAFASYAANMQGKAWHKTDVVALFMNTQTGKEKLFYTTYTP